MPKSTDAGAPEILATFTYTTTLLLEIRLQDVKDFKVGCTFSTVTIFEDFRRVIQLWK